MKSKYQQPRINIVNVQPAQMIAASIGMNAADAEAPGMSRRGDSLWGDDGDGEDYDQSDDGDKGFGYGF